MNHSTDPDAPREPVHDEKCHADHAQHSDEIPSPLAHAIQKLPHTRSCYVCGESNPMGLKLRFETDGEVAICRFVPVPEHSGFKNTIHGGITATVLDEVMVWAVGVRVRRFVYCAEMTVRYASPGRPGALIIGTGRLMTNRRNKLFETMGELRTEEGALIASATGKYLPVPDTVSEEVLKDFTGDPVVLDSFIRSFRSRDR